MSVLLSLQGCMAVGKTSAAQYLCKTAPDVHIFREDSAAVIAQVKARGLHKDVFADYIEIQRLWINHAIARAQQAQQYALTVMDTGAEEIAFYTLHYPRTIGQDWDVETALHDELTALRACMPRRILFLQASEATLRARKAADETRSRTFFAHYLTQLLPRKQAWLLRRDDVDVLDTEHLSKDEVGARVLAWVRKQQNA